MLNVYYNEKYVDFAVDLRWHFDWKTRPSKYGAWTDPGECDSTTAWKQPKDGLVRAAIIGRRRFTREIFTLSECDGHEFIEFRWIAAVPLPMRGISGPAMKHHGSIQGMSLVTADEKLHAYVNGSVVREPNLERRVLSRAWS